MSTGLERGGAAERWPGSLQMAVVVVSFLLVLAALVAAVLALADKVGSLPHDGPEREARAVPAAARCEKIRADA